MRRARRPCSVAALACVSELHRAFRTNNSDVAELRRVCDVIYRSSTARQELCQAIHEPSPELALRHLGEFAVDPGVWRRREWAEAFRNAPSLTAQVSLVLERVGQWYAVRKAPRRITMEEPWEWYPLARRMRRTFVFHHGPPNSGKTHAALNALAKAKSGVYCAPLKALAGQCWAQLNAMVPCDLLIGDERRFGGGAEHVSCTVEMTPTDLQVDVGVIDEIQLLGDRDRGWAWTRALLGLPAREIHLCGEQRAIGLVKNLLSKTYEHRRLSLQEHQRLAALQPCPPLHGNLANLQNGDCLVCFSRRSVMEYCQRLGQQPGTSASCVYGAMPFEVRERQIAEFNAGAKREVRAQEERQLIPKPREAMVASKKTAISQDQRSPAPQENAGIPAHRHVLVSTDAIGYGLNTNIERIVFSTMRKYDGQSNVDVPATTVKQVCGRAGRYGHVRQHAAGQYTTLHDGEDYTKLTTSMRSSVPDLTRAGLLPTADILQLYVELVESKRQRNSGNAGTHGTNEGGQASFYSTLKQFTQECTATSLFFPCDWTRSLLRVAKVLDDIHGLTLKDRILFCYLPLSDSGPESLRLVHSYAADHAAGRIVPLRIDEAFTRITTSSRYRAALASCQAGSTTVTHGHRSRVAGVNEETQRELAKLERVYRQAEVYCWLSWRFQSTFVHREAGSALKHRITSAMEDLMG